MDIFDPSDEKFKDINCTEMCKMCYGSKRTLDQFWNILSHHWEPFKKNMESLNYPEKNWPEDIMKTFAAWLEKLYIDR